MKRRWSRWLLLCMWLPWLGACGHKPPLFAPNQGQQGVQAPVNPQAEQQRLANVQRQLAQQRSKQRCLKERPSLVAQMASLRKAELQLARVKEKTYVPLPAPDPWDETRESRFRQEDREADWQRHLQAQEAWQRREQNRRASWTANHQDRLLIAQERLDREAQALRSRRPELFTGPGSIEFNPEIAQRLRNC
jgi:hypothetical protein